MWDRPEEINGVDEYPDMKRAARFRDPYFLDISGIRQTVCSAVATATKVAIEPALFIPSFVRVSPVQRSVFPNAYLDQSPTATAIS